MRDKADKSDIVTLTCEEHGFTPRGSKPPAKGCKQCLMVFFLDIVARVPVEKQAEELDKLESIVKAACKAEDQGKFEVSLYRHPKIEITYDADEDEELIGDSVIANNPRVN